MIGTVVLTREMALTVARYLIASTATVSSLELLAVRRMYADDGILSWSIMATAHRRLPTILEELRNRLFSKRGTVSLALLRLLLALALFVPGLERTATGVLYLGVLAIQMILSYRAGFGGDGSDQMSNIVLAGLAYDSFATRTGVLRDAGLWFIGIECVMSYFVAGVAKLISNEWRSGAAPIEVLRSATYGSATGTALLGAIPGGSAIVAWATICVECLFPLALFAPLPIALPLVAAGVLFHIGNAAFMGLNTFLTAFVAAYPIVLLLNQNSH